MQQLTALDRVVVHFDQGLRTLLGQPLLSTRDSPADMVEEADLNGAEKRLSGRLMRVNHAGEICAQALYQGQAVLAREAKIHSLLQQSAREENDHLLWCQKRIDELDGHASLLNPLWYLGSLGIGAGVALLGDRWSLGFMAETERQVVKHLDEHLRKLPAQDEKSRIILQQLKADEGRHAEAAMQSGGLLFPKPLSWLMGRAAKIMTKTAFWV